MREEAIKNSVMGKDDLSTLTNEVDLALGDSHFNEDELKMLGFKKTAVLLVSIFTIVSQAGIFLKAASTVCRIQLE